MVTSFAAMHRYFPLSSNLVFLICRAPLAVKVNRSPVVIVIFDPCFLQTTNALGLECFILQKNLDVSPSVTVNDEGVTATLDEIPENKKNATEIFFSSTYFCKKHMVTVLNR